MLSWFTSLLCCCLLWGVCYLCYRLCLLSVCGIYFHHLSCSILLIDSVFFIIVVSASFLELFIFGSNREQQQFVLLRTDWWKPIKESYYYKGTITAQGGDGLGSGEWDLPQPLAFYVDYSLKWKLQTNNSRFNVLNKISFAVNIISFIERIHSFKKQ